MQHPLISIVLCTYNGEKFLEQQIESLLQQTYPNIEIIISDDASTDGTKNILLKYANHSNIKVYWQEKNLGYPKHFETAALYATGDFISFSDQDDIWLKNKIEKLYNTINGFTLVFSNSLLVDETGKQLNIKLSSLRKIDKTIYGSKGFLFTNVVTGHGMMFKRDLLNYALPIPEGTFHDWWFAVFAANLNGIVYVNEPLTLYRQHSSKITITINREKALRRTFSKRYISYLDDLRWIELMKNNKTELDKGFYNNLYNLFQQKSKGRFVWPLFYFLFKNRKEIYRFHKKSPISNMFDMRKIARGEKK